MDFTKDYKNKVNSLLMERWGYGKMDEAIEEASEEVLGSPGGDSKFSCGMKGGKWEEPDGPCIFAEADKTPKNVQALSKRLDQLKSIIATIDDPIEVLSAMNAMADKIVALNPDFTDGEKRRVFIAQIKDLRDKLKTIGKEDLEQPTEPGKETAKAGTEGGTGPAIARLKAMT